MKKLLISIFMQLLVVIGIACNRTEANLINVAFDGVNYTITMQLDVGGGILGATTGADNWTGTFAYGVYGPITMNFLGYGPPNVTSDTTACTNPSTTFTGSFGANFGVAYISPGCFYTCVSSTALCGTPHTNIDTFTLTVSEVPDSIVFFGLEGAGNPVAGCYPNSDMRITFNLLPVEWGHVETRIEEKGIRLIWNTYFEENNNFFQVERSVDAQNWEHIGTVNGVGNSNTLQTYSFLDQEPLQGQAYYRIKQVDIDDAYSYSDIVAFKSEETLQVDVFPNPASDRLVIASKSIHPDASCILRDVSGAIVKQKIVDLSMESSLDLSDLNSGMYILEIRTLREQIKERIVIL